MRALLVSLATLALAQPVAAQVSATIHIGPIRIGGGGYDDYHDYDWYDRYDRSYLEPIVVVVYQPRNYGHWRQTAPYWRPITVYEYHGRYYQRPFRQARPVVIYHYRGNYFHAPRDRDWDSYRVRFERNEWKRWRDNDRNEWRNDWRDPRRERPDYRGDRRDRTPDRIDRRDDRPTRVEPRRDQRDNRPTRVEPRRDQRNDRPNRVEPRRDQGNRPAINARSTAPERRAAPADNRARRRNG